MPISILPARATAISEHRANGLTQKNSLPELGDIIAGNLTERGWSWAASQQWIPTARTIWIPDAHRDDGKRFVVRADEKLTAVIELESAMKLD